MEPVDPLSGVTPSKPARSPRVSSLTWPEIESEVHIPGAWLTWLVGGTFTLIGVPGLVFVVRSPDPRAFWIGTIVLCSFALMGVAVLVLTAVGRIWPAVVRHAAAEVLPEVPREPVLREGSIVSSRLTHKLVEGPRSWEFRPDPAVDRGTRRFLYGFGIPFFLVFIGLLSWTWRGGPIDSWPMAIAAATFVTLLCGGSAFWIIGMILTSHFRSLGRLDIPHGGGDLELDIAAAPDGASRDLLTGLNRVLKGKGDRETWRIPADRVAAVQVVPWRLTVVKSTTWAVQGTLVLRSADGAAWERIPILLTGDFARGARLMETLADVLRVPYLFGADREGWQAEEARAKSRPPLSSGGFVS